MNRSNLPEEQILYAIPQGKNGIPVCKSLPRDRDERPHILRLENEVRPPKRERAAATPATEERIQLIETTCPRPLDRQIYVVGGPKNKTYSPHSSENCQPGFETPFRSVALGLDEAARMISPRCVCVFTIWTMSGLGLGIRGFGYCCVSRADRSETDAMALSTGWIAHTHAGAATHAYPLHGDPGSTPIGPTDRWIKDFLHTTMADGHLDGKTYISQGNSYSSATSIR